MRHKNLLYYCKVYSVRFKKKMQTHSRTVPTSRTAPVRHWEAYGEGAVVCAAFSDTPRVFRPISVRHASHCKAPSATPGDFRAVFRLTV